MERLKINECQDCKDWDGYVTDCFKNCIKPFEGLEEFNRYKDLEEQGLLLELPRRVGDTVYTNTSMQGWYFRKGNRPYEAKIVFIGINGADNFINVDFGNGRMLQFKFSEIGKTVFLTQAEAKEALKEMEGDKHGEINNT